MNTFRAPLYKALLLIPCILGLLCSTSAQKSYKFTSKTGTYSNLIGSTSLNNGQLWDDPEYVVSIGFTFEFFDKSFTTVNVSDFVWFDANQLYQIDVLSADFIDLGTGASLSPISYLLTGTPGSQILKIEWQNAGFYSDVTTTDFVNVQLWLYEGTNAVEIHIGPNSVLNSNSYGGDEGGTVGLTNFNSNEKIYLVGSPGAPTVSSGLDQITGTPINGQEYRFEKCGLALFEVTHGIGELVSFAATGSNTTSYNWNFGDGDTSSAKNPTHTYADTVVYLVTLITNGDCGPDTVSHYINLSPNGIAINPSLNSEIRIYPNPFNNIITLSSFEVGSLSAQIRILDLLGRVLIRQEMKDDLLTIDTSHLESATYILEVRTDSGVMSKKIIKVY